MNMAARVFSRQLLRPCCKIRFLSQGRRTFLSDAYKCQEEWNDRTSLPMFKTLNMDNFYVALDKNFQSQGEVLPVDVDIFALCASSDQHLEDLQDVLHRFRRTPLTVDALPSTSHTVVRTLLETGSSERRQRLLHMLDDRVNYGVFLDHYVANMAMNTFLQEGNNRDAARVATQLMLQEDWAHPISRPLALLSCYSYLLKPVPEPWRQPDPVEDEDEETEYVRVQYLRNEWHDGHFDLREAPELLGKTLAWLGGDEPGAAGASCRLLGWALWQQWGKLQRYCTGLQQPVCHDTMRRVTELVSAAGEQLPEPKQLLSLLTGLPTVPETLESTLRSSVSAAVAAQEPADIAALQQLYGSWQQRRLQELQLQRQRIDRQQRIKALEEKRQYLRERQRLLWFFDNEEQIQAEGARHWDQPAKPTPLKYQRLLKKRRITQEDYVPPEVRRAHKD